jgi:hypothetical protein
MGWLSNLFFGEPSKDEMAMQAAAEKGRAMRDAKAQAKFDAMIEAQRNGGGTVVGGVRLTADGQVDLDGFDLSSNDAEILERFKATHNGGFDPSVQLPTNTLDARTQQQMISGMAGLPPAGQYDPLAKTRPELNKHGSIIAKVEDIPSSAYLDFKSKAGLDAGGDSSAESEEELRKALAAIGAKPRELSPK